MIIKPFIKPVFTKLIEHDDSFVSSIFNKLLSAGYGNYGLVSLIYLRKPAEKYMEEEQYTKTEFNIELMYKMLMQLSTVKNNPNYISNNYSYYINNIQNSINHYSKALSYIDKNVVSKSRVIKDSLIIYGQLPNEIKNYKESFKNKNIVSYENTNFLNSSNHFYYSKYNTWNNSKASRLNSRSVTNINNEALYAITNKVFNDNNIFNKYGYGLSENIKFASLSSKNNTIFNEQLFNEVNNYLYKKQYKNIANYEEHNLLNNNLKSINAPHYSLGSNNRFDNIILKSFIKREFYFNNLSYAQHFREIKNNADIFRSSYKNLYNNKFKELNEFFLNESLNVQNSQEKIIKLNRDVNNNFHYYSHDNIWNTMKTSIKNRDFTFNFINSMLNRNLRFNTGNVSNSYNFNFINEKKLNVYDSFNDGVLNYSINMESSNIQNLQGNIIKLNRNSNNNILEKQIDNIAYSFNNYLYNKLYKNIDNYRSENIASYEYVDYLNTNSLKTSNDFYWLQSNISNKFKDSIKNKNSIFNIINSMLHISRNQISNRNLRFNTDNPWNSYNSNLINEELFNSYDSFNDGILKKILYPKVLDQVNINKGFFINKSLRSNNIFDNINLKNLIKKDFYFTNLSYAEQSKEIKNNADIFRSNYKSLYINSLNKFNELNQFIYNELSSIENSQEKIIKLNGDSNNNILKKYINDIGHNLNNYLYNKLYKNIDNYKNIASYEYVNFFNSSDLKTRNILYYLQNNIRNTTKALIKNRNSTFNIINSMLYISRNQILNRNLRLNTDNAWNSDNSNYVNEEFINTYYSFNKRSLNKILYSKTSNQLNHFIDMESSYIQNLQEKIIKLDINSNNNSLEKQINNITHNFHNNFNNYICSQLYKNITNHKDYKDKNIVNYRNENITNNEAINFLNNNILKTSNTFYASQENILGTVKASIKNRNFVFNSINRILNIKGNEILNRNFRFNEYNQRNSYNSFNEKFINAYDSFNNESINKIRYSKISKQININKGTFINKSSGSNNLVNNIIFKSVIKKNLYFSDLFYAQQSNKIKKYADTFRSSLKNLHVNQFNKLSQFLDNEHLSIQNLQEEITKRNVDLNNNIFKNQINNITQVFNNYLYGQLYKNTVSYRDENISSIEDNNFLNSSILKSSNSFYYSQGYLRNITKVSMRNNNSIFNNINKILSINKLLHSSNNFENFIKKNFGKIVFGNIISDNNSFNRYHFTLNNNRKIFDLGDKKNTSFNRQLFNEINYKDNFNNSIKRLVQKKIIQLWNKNSLIIEGLQEKPFINNILNKMDSYLIANTNLSWIQKENRLIGNTSFLVQKNFVIQHSNNNTALHKDFSSSFILDRYEKSEFKNGISSNYIMHKVQKVHADNNEITEELYNKKVNIKHKRVQATVSKEESITEDIETEHNSKYVTHQNLKRFVKEAVETIIDNKLKNEKSVQAEEEKQVEIISTKVLAKIERELRYERRRRGLM